MGALKGVSAVVESVLVSDGCMDEKVAGFKLRDAFKIRWAFTWIWNSKWIYVYFYGPQKLRLSNQIQSPPIQFLILYYVIGGST